MIRGWSNQRGAISRDNDGTRIHCAPCLTKETTGTTPQPQNYVAKQQARVHVLVSVSAWDELSSVTVKKWRLRATRWLNPILRTAPDRPPATRCAHDPGLFETARRTFRICR
jgi:hypothetical protein